MPQSSRILFFFTSTSRVPISNDPTLNAKKGMQQNDPTVTTTLLIFCDTCSITLLQGWYLPEAAHPYYVLSPHFTIDFAAPAGPNPPMDPQSQEVSTVPIASYDHGDIICFSNLKTMKTPGASSTILMSSLSLKMQCAWVL